MRNLHTKLGSIITLMFVLVLTGLSLTSVSAQCPVIQFEDMRGIIGFPQFDNTSQCGDADTLSVLVFTDAPGDILGFELTVNLEDGLAYGGFSETHFGGGTTIAYGGGSETSPKFSLGGVTDPTDVMIANIGLVPNCNLDLSKLYNISFEYEYTFQDTMGNIIECEGVYEIDQEFNSALKRPELNMAKPSPTVANITALGTPRCQNINLSQDGLQAFVNEMEFAVCGFAADGNLSISSLTANGIALPYTENAVDSTVTAAIDGSYFLNNTSPNPTDLKFNTGEKLLVRICYNADSCPDVAKFPLTYKAYYGCEGDTCNITTQASSLNIVPSGASDPVISASFAGPLEICGSEGTVTLDLTNPSTDEFQNAYTDLRIGFETCEQSNLDIVAVRLNNIELPAAAFGWEGDDLFVTFAELDTDFDGIGVGLEDLDMDGKVDDLGGGKSISLELDLAVLCAVNEVDPTSLDCPSIDCGFASFYVRAKSNCGNQFTRFPMVANPFSIQYGPISVSNEGEVNLGEDNAPIFGYDFGKSGEKPEGTFLTGMANIELCYDFNSENMSPCPSGADLSLKLSLSGDSRIVQDFEVIPGSMSYTVDGGAPTSIADGTEVWMSDPVEEGKRMLFVNGGSETGMVCYQVGIQLDTAYCSPVQYIAVSQQVIEYCADCDCEIVKACKNTQFAVDPEYFDCPCLIGHKISPSRKNYGFADHAMTMPLSKEDVLATCPADVNRYTVGDTMEVEVAYDIKHLDALNNMNMWKFGAYVYDPNGVGSIANLTGLPVVPDANTGGIIGIEINTGAGRYAFSFDELASCESGDVQVGFPALSGYGILDLTSSASVNRTGCGNSGSDYRDNLTNNLYVRNAQLSNECGNVTTSTGGNCLQDFFDLHNFEVGDSIILHYEYPMVRNPLRAAAIAGGWDPPLSNQLSLYFHVSVYNQDEFGNASYCYTFNQTSCNSYPNVEVADFGDVTAFTELDLDNCGGKVKHTFSITNPPPVGWYQCEFKPLINIDDVDLPIIGPLAYCNSAELTDFDGNVMSVAVDSTINLSCTPVNGYSEDLCAVESGDLGYAVMDLASQGVRPLGVGLMNNDSLTLEYDLCMLCPSDFALNYELIYDYSLISLKELNSCGFLCNQSTSAANTWCDELTFAQGENYYDLLMLDTLQYTLNASSMDFVPTDNRMPDAGMSASNEGADLVASGTPGTSVEYQEIKLCNEDGTATQLNVQGSVAIPSSVRFDGAYSIPDGSGTPLTTALISDDGTTKTYSIQTLASSLAVGECETIYIGTTLLFCPIAPALPPEICVNAVSGCAPAEVAAALGGSGTCGGGQTCYAYIFGEADLQTEWYETPVNAELCQTDTFYIRIKNTKTITLLDLETYITNVPGLMIDPTSWAVAYPGGSVGFNGTFGTLIGDGTSASVDAAFMSVPAPNLNGQVYSWSDDADWIPQVDMNGLPGVFSMADSNNVSIRFIGITDCDNFLSGAKMQTETNASDPCSPGMLMSGLVDTQPIVIDGADPKDNAQILTTAQPKMAYCTGGPSTFGLTALNIGENPTSPEVECCIIIPSSALSFEMGSVEFTSPAYTPTAITETVDGDNMLVCFDAPALMPGQKFSVQFKASQPPTAVCGPIVLGMDVKSFEPAVVCATAPGMMCGVFVQNSINPSLIIDMGPPLETTDVRLNRQCNTSVNPEQFCYEVDMTNPGMMNYTGTVRIGIHDDVTADGYYDEIVDAELAGFDHAGVSVDAGATVTLSMCLDVPAAQACPIILRQSFETACACDEATTPFNNIPPAFLDTIECKVLCPTEAFMTEICGDYTFTLTPAEGGVITNDGSNLSVILNTGFGVSQPVILTATEAIGDCVSEASIELKSSGDYLPTNLVFQVCEGECIDPDLMIPENIADGSSIEITQAGTATVGDDLDMSDPEICGVTPGATDTYTVTITATPTCVYTFDFTVEVLPVGVLSLTDTEVCNHPLFGGTIEADAAFDNYQFFLVLSNGTEVLKYSGPLNAYNSNEEGNYLIKATRVADMCPSVASATIGFGNCVDLALKKTIKTINPGPYPTTGGTVEYSLMVYNQGGVEMNQIELTDYVPAGLTNNDPNWTPIGMTDGIVTNTVATPGFVSGDSVEVTIVLTVNPGANFDNTTNIAEISAMQDSGNNDVSDDDIDSTPDMDPTNDPGGNPNTSSDNVVDGDGTNGGGANGDTDPTTDEDDHDPATLPIFDLALTKTVDPASVPASGMYTVGDDIVFLINVINQGSIDATDVVIKDLIPCGMMSFDHTLVANAGWSAPFADAQASSGQASEYMIPLLTAGAILQIPISMTLDAPSGCPSGTIDPYLNFGFIDSALDGNGNPSLDVDSSPGGLTPNEEITYPNTNGDNDTSSTGDGDAGSQDDSDPANIQIFDLALSKILNPDNGPYSYGDVASFEICVTNQGNVMSDSIQILDVIPAGYSFDTNNSAQWTDNGNGTAIWNSTPADFTVIGGVLDFNEQVCTTIDLIVQAAASAVDAYTNTAGISGATTIVDPDGTGPNPPTSTFVTSDNDGNFSDDPTLDAGGELGSASDAMTSDTTDPAIGGNGSGAPGDIDPVTDADESDIAGIDIVDFALTKVIASPMAPFSYGDTITYDITVYNQGTVAGMNITLTDYAPVGLIYIASPIINPGWTGSSPSHMYMINSTIVPGDSIVIPVKMIVNADGVSAADYTNIAEIFSVFDDAGVNITNDDVDSQPDGNPLNDAGGAAGTGSDNAVDGSGTNGSGSNGDSDPTTDEDDNDPAFLQIFDLALTKEIVGGPYGIGDLVEYKITTINQGNTPVTNVEINDYIPSGLEFMATDNTAAGWGFVGPNANGITVSTTITDVIAPGGMVMTSLFLRVIIGDGSAVAYTNFSEISSFEDTDGNSSLTDPTIVDSDSTPDNDPDNDAGGNPGGNSDGTVDGDGSGLPGDDTATTDEDDADPAFLAIADLALIKTTAEMGPFSYGDTVTFDIVVMNQGNVTASNIEVTDYVASGFMYLSSNDAVWSESGGFASTTISGPLTSGGIKVVSIDLVIINSSDPTDAYTNVAEISMAFEEDGTTPFDDVDSNADNNPTNDPGGAAGTDSDNSTGGSGTNGSGVPGDEVAATDEDDADPVLIEIVDVAQTKMLVTMAPYSYGDLLEFDIVTYNQGNVPLTNVVVTDYIPTGFTYDPVNDGSGWSQVGANAQYTITDVILPGTSVTTKINLILTMTTGGTDNYTNVSEVSMMQDTSGMDVSMDDADSDINDDPNDNGGGNPGTDSDDSVDGDGTANPNDPDGTTDEDNSDPALVTIVDLALLKNTIETGPFSYGDTVTFFIEVTNQGNVDANNIVVTDYIPAGYDYAASSATSWAGGVTGPVNVTYTIADTLLAGETETLYIDLIVKPNTGGGTGKYTNVAEISSMTDLDGNDISDDDIDSSPDAINGNDPGGNATTGSDDVVEGDGTGNPGDTDPSSDEDDSDPELIAIVDLAQTKDLITVAPHSYGDILEFKITTINQGNIPATNILVSDYVPAGFEFVEAENPEWSGVDGAVSQTVTHTITETLLADQISCDTISLRLAMSTGGSDNYTNVSEITMVQDTTGTDITMEDVDSTPDGTNGNDGGGNPNTDSDGSVDGDGSGDSGDDSADTDEDDSDPALVTIVDLALAKKLNSGEVGPFSYGDTLTYDIEVSNQGNVDANNIKVNDFIPVGFNYAASSSDTWTGGVTGPVTVTHTIMDTLAAGETKTLMIDLIFKSSAPMSSADDWTNIAELESFQDTLGMDITMDDVDSEGDSDPNNDAGSNPSDGTNDTVDGDGTGSPNDGNPATDEDDNDPEIIEVFDLALKKETIVMTGVNFGDTITFMITVENQGNIPATDIQITDYVPTGFAFDMTKNPPLGWMDNMDGTSMVTLTDKLLPGESTTIDYHLVIMMSNMNGAFVNYSEISMASDTLGNSTNGTGPDGGIVDVDSNPDNSNTNDHGGDPGSDADNEMDGNGTGGIGDGVASTDEDDHDPAIIEVIDVALTKKVADGQGPFSFGNPVLFDIEVLNQGNVPLHNVQVTDYIPEGFVYDTITSNAIGWDPSGNTATYTISNDTLEMWESVIVQISLIPVQIIPSNNPDAWTNVAEVSMLENEDGDDISDMDIDSNADADPNDDPGGAPNTDSDGSVDGDGDNGGGAPGDTDADTDEDDSDPAMLPIFDLALTKELVYPDSIYQFGDEMEFFITVQNQGNVPATNVTVTEYVPAALTEVGATNDPKWMFGTPNASYLIEDVILPAQSDTIYLNMIFQQAASASDYVNYAEISMASDTLGNSTDGTGPDGGIVDVDSSPDDTNDDPGGSPDSDNDNFVDGTGTGTPGDVVAATDEDDHDPVQLGFVDMALEKHLVAPTTPVVVGSDVSFEIVVTNQGTFDMKDISVIDYIPDGFLLSANDTNGWTPTSDGNATQTIPDTLSFMESHTLEIVLTVQPNANLGNMVNVAELTSFFFSFGDEATDFDIDSEANDTQDDDAGGALGTASDDTVDGDGTGTPGDSIAATDEDDHDPAAPKVFDLALRKIVDNPMVSIPGDVVTFIIEVHNQGNIDAYNVIVRDYIAAGYTLSPTDANGWTADVANADELTNEIAFIEAGEMAILKIDLVINEGAQLADLKNIAEIDEAKDKDGNVMIDIDSSGDGDSGNDDEIDNAIDSADDEDDADPATPMIFDLALEKATMAGPIVMMGDTITYTITLYNQGNVVAEDIEIVDYLDAPLLFDAGLNNGWDDSTGDLYFTYDGPLNPGDQVGVDLVLIIDPNSPPVIEIINFAEIVSSTDDTGDDMTHKDIDSSSDNMRDNDAGGIPGEDSDGHISDNGKDGDGDGVMDEDDHDPERLFPLDCHDLVCITNINLSLDENCSAEITAAMILTEATNHPDLYEIEITDEFGNVVDNLFDATDIGTVFNVSVSLPGCGLQSCVSEITVEDKFPPTLDCGPELIIACNALSTVAAPVPMDNCGGATLVLLNEVTTNLPCDPDYLMRVERTYHVVDAQGLISPECTQTILLERVDLTGITFPPSYTIAGSNALNCPAATDPSATGVPMYAGLPIFPIVPSALCNVSVTYVDTDLGSIACVDKIMRVWTVGEWWCGTLTPPRTWVQMIETVDFTGPSLTCPSDFTVSTSGVGLNNCVALVEIPGAIVSDLCNEPVRVDLETGGPLITSNGGMAELGVGVHTIRYIAYDACDNSSECSMEITVVDNFQPTVLCLQNTTVSLKSDGTAQAAAEVFDNGSYDDCGLGQMEVRRMTDNCGVVGNTDFGPTVDFCCADVGTDVMVVLRVYDSSGNYNDCMIMVEVQDKEVAVLSCPANQTVPCTTIYDLTNLDVQFGSATVLDNCSAQNITHTYVEDINACGVGTLTRNFSMPDGQGGTMSCSQVITFENNDLFDLTDIIWPSDYATASVCGANDLDPGNLSSPFDYPVLIDGVCDQAGMDYKDQTFEYIPGSDACFKIIRTWTVIDWCQRRSDGSFESWTHDQILKVTNSIAPTIATGCTDVLVETFDPTCMAGVVELIVTATDDCTPADQLAYNYSIDYESDGSIDATGSGNDASGSYEVGIHHIYWEVLDKCGNVTLCDNSFEIRNAKAPTPICIQGLSAELTLMDTDGDNIGDTEMVVIWAADFDGGSNHPCGYPLNISFSPDITDISKEFVCGDVGQQGIQMWVTDINGNQDFCSTYILITDNSGDCPTTLTVDVQGRVYTEQNEDVEEVEVSLMGSGNMDETETDGMYGFMDMPNGGSYTLSPERLDGVMNGVSTLDLVLIQKHILGLRDLGSPYKMIAADVNRDDRITAIDLIALRKVILGIHADFPDNESWRFVDALYQFPRPTDPWYETFDEEYEIGTLTGNMWVDFIGVKIGDVNNSVTSNATSLTTESRGSQPLNFEITDQELTRGEEVSVSVSASNFTEVSGYQFTMEHEGLELVDVRSGALEVSLSNMGQISKAASTMSWHTEQSMSLGRDAVLFELVFRSTASLILSDRIRLTDKVTRAESYSGVDLSIEGVSLEIRDELVTPVSTGMELSQNVPNPWLRETVINLSLETGGIGTMVVKDAQGRVVLSNTYDWVTGDNKIVIKRSDLPSAGVYFYTVIVGAEQQTKPMVVIK